MQTVSLRFSYNPDAIEFACYLLYPPMNSPLTNPRPSPARFLTGGLCLLLLLASFTGCGGKLVTETVAEPKGSRPAPPPKSVPTWLGNTSRNFYGTGPWSDEPSEILWEFETKLISGRLHKDPWGGTSWPGQPSLGDDRVYFGSADSNLYCLNAKDGTLIWSFKTEDSLKSTPTIAGNHLLASGLDHYLYCLDPKDGTLLWKYKAGFEIDGTVAVIDDRVYFGSEDGFLYCLNLEDGSLVYQTERLGSMEGSVAASGDRLYVGTEQG